MSKELLASAFITSTLLALCTLGTAPAEAGEANSGSNLTGLSIEELSNIDVSSVSKKLEPLSTAPAAIYVITQDDVLRSGATSVPEMLRLAPNLEVAQASANTYAITARGFNSTFSDKLLVMIDGRNVYTPLQGGVYWDMQTVSREDLDRIEVISGPGATLWGANAVNGVINIITRSSADTQGGMMDLVAGNLERSATVRYGGRLNDDLTYRVYATGATYNATTTTTGADARDDWSMPQGGFRFDWARDTDKFTFQGDIYDGSEREPSSPPDQNVSGANVLARWQHDLSSTSQFQVQAYYDRTHRFDTGGFTLDTYDIDAQHTFALADWNSVIWGGGYRIYQDYLTGVPELTFAPPSRRLTLANGFVQDTISITKTLKLTAGTKVESDPFSGLAAIPSVRLAWNVTNAATVWAAVSDAVRAPTRLDHDIVEKLGTLVFLTGSSNFRAERLIAYEAGTRIQPATNLSFSISGFYNVYDDLRSIEYTPVTLLPLYYGNLMAGHVYGVEVWANYRATPWWQLATGFNAQHEDLFFKPGSSQLAASIQQSGDDPNHQFSLRSTLNLGPKLSWEADLRYVGALPNPVVAGYVEVNSRLGWQVSQSVEIALSGVNLLHRRHIEFAPGTGTSEISRNVLLDTRWKF